MDALKICVRLTHYDRVNTLVIEWRRFALNIEMDNPDATSCLRSRNSSWVPPLPFRVPYVRRNILRKRHSQTAAEPAEDGAWKDKLAARQIHRRIQKAVQKNASAVQRKAHVVCIEGLPVRPKRAACSDFKRKGKWMRLADKTCPACDAVRSTDAVEKQRAFNRLTILPNLAKLEGCLQSAKAKRPNLKRQLARRAREG